MFNFCETSHMKLSDLRVESPSFPGGMMRMYPGRIPSGPSGSAFVARQMLPSPGTVDLPTFMHRLWRSIAYLR